MTFKCHKISLFGNSLVTGRNHHVGTTALPRELQLENVVMPPEPEQIRIMVRIVTMPPNLIPIQWMFHNALFCNLQTPPRSITLQDPPYHPNNINHGRSMEGEDETLIVEDNQARFLSTLPNGRIGGGLDVSFVARYAFNFVCSSP